MLAGRRVDTAGAEEIVFDDSEYADDTALLFCSRRDVEEQTPALMEHFADWGMEVHAGAPGKDSKSEVLFCPAPPHVYSDSATYDGADLSDVQLPAGRSMPVVFKFPYLGDYVAADGADTLAVETRVAAAGKAFGALRKCLFSSSTITRAAKTAVYEALILSILLYGCESWCLTEELLQRLRVFHAQCLRAMSRVTRKHTWEHRISSMQLMQELGLDAIDFYVARRQLRWLGHVSRMGWERLPRRMLSAWVPRARPRGAPRLTYGRSVAKAMDVFNLDHTRGGRSSPPIARAGGRCCRAARRRRRFASRPRPRRPCPCPTPRCAPGVLRRRAPTPPSTRRCEPRRRLRASAG